MSHSMCSRKCYKMHKHKQSDIRKGKIKILNKWILGCLNLVSEIEILAKLEIIDKLYESKWNKNKALKY